MSSAWHIHAYHHVSLVISLQYPVRTLISGTADLLIIVCQTSATFVDVERMFSKGQILLPHTRNDSDYFMPSLLEQDGFYKDSDVVAAVKLQARY